MSSIDIKGTQQFQEILASSEKLILVDFWAVWCGPCRMLSPILHDLVEKYDDKIQLVKINVDEDENAELAMNFQVRSIPQVTFFLKGVQVDQFIGVLPPEEIEAYITKHVS